jgi:hypothetical protein
MSVAGIGQWRLLVDVMQRSQTFGVASGNPTRRRFFGANVDRFDSAGSGAARTSAGKQNREQKQAWREAGD